MNRDELAASMAAKSAQVADLMRRTDVDGRIAPVVETEEDKRRDALERGLRLAIDNHDEHAASVISEALAKPAAAAGRPAGAAEDGPTVSADQGARPQPPGPPSLAEALAAAEAAGDVRESIRLKGLQHDINRRRADHDDSRGLFR